MGKRDGAIMLLMVMLSSIMTIYGVYRVNETLGWIFGAIICILNWVLAGACGVYDKRRGRTFTKEEKRTNEKNNI